MPDSWLLTLGIVTLVIFILFRRARRILGRQKFSIGRLWLRLGIILTVCVILFVVVSAVRGLVPLMGLVIGSAVGLLGLYLTRFESVDGDLYYTPNRYVGGAVLSLLVSRMIYRWIKLREVTEAVQSGSSPLESIRSSPATSMILFVVLGFYVCYYASLLIKGRIFSGNAANTTSDLPEG